MKINDFSEEELMEAEECDDGYSDFIEDFIIDRY